MPRLVAHTCLVRQFPLRWAIFSKTGIPMQNDPDSDLVKPCYAVIYTPSRRRKRFPENCVTRVDSADDAIARADGEKDLHPARVLGPSRSSEGFRLYYLLEWLDGG